MSLKKTTTQDAPHATFVNERIGWTWKVLKVYAMAKSDKKNPYARWMVAVSSPNTFGGVDMGDNYIREIINNARLVECTDEFRAYFDEVTS